VRALALTLVPAAGFAKDKKPKAPKTSGTVKKKEKDADKPPPPGDKSTNEGGQGRINATEDAGKGGEGPIWQR